MAAPNPSSAQPLFSCLVPGRPITSDFVPVESDRLVLSIKAPVNIPQIAITLLRPELPLNYGVGIYYALHCNDSTECINSWAFLGYIDHQCPTSFYKLSLLDDNVAVSHHISDLSQCTLFIGLNLQPLKDLNEMVNIEKANIENKTLVSAQGIAHDLHKFITSFDYDIRNPPKHGIVLPPNVVDRWLTRFTEKHAKDPFFWLEKKD